MTFPKLVLVLFLIVSHSGFGQTVSITASQPIANEAGPINGEYTISVTGAGFLQNLMVILALNGASTAAENVDFSGLQTTVQVQADFFGNGSTTISLIPQQDFIIEPDETVVWDIVDDFPNYTIDPINSSATVTILDDDVAGVLVNGLDNASGPATGTTTEDGSVTANFLFTLTSEPSAAVTIPLNNTRPDEGSVQGNVTLDATNWDTGVIVTVTGVNDFVDDGDVIYPIGTQTPTTADPDYDLLIGANIAQISITNQDDDVADFNVSTITNDTSEDNDVGTFDVVLTAQPLTDVVLDVVSEDPGEGSVDLASLTFTNTNWDQRQTVIVTGVDDPIVDGPQSYDITISVDTGSSDAAFVGLADKVVTVTNLDNDEFEVSIRATEDAANESPLETGEFTVELDQVNNTGSPLVVEFSISGTATLNSDYDLTPASAETLPTGTVSIPDGANEATIILTPIDDTDVEPDETVIITLNPGNGYTVGTSDSDTVTIESDDVPDIRVIESGGDTETTESGDTDTFRVALTAQPQSNVVLSVFSPDEDEVIVSPANLIFTNVNWNNLQTVTVSGVDDFIVDGDQIVNVRLQVIDGSSDDNFDNVPDRIVPVTNVDDDVVGINVDTTTGNTSEIGGNAVFEFTLNSQPTANVVIPISGYDTTEGSGPNEVIITPANWQTPVELVVNGVDDVVDDGDVTYTLITGDVTSADSAYDALSGSDVPDFEITNQDNDQARITIAGGAVDEDVATGELNIPVTLDIEKPSGFEVDYTLIGVSATGGVDFDDDPGSIVFLGNAGETQLITVPIVNDNLIENSESFTVQLGMPTNGVLLNGDGSATGTILDDDNCLPSPILDTSVSTNFCDVLMADLNDYVLGSPPAGSQLIWSTSSNQLQESAYRPSEVTSPGSYFGFYLDDDEDCFSPTVEVELVINTTPQILTTTASERCGPGGVILEATAETGAFIFWYDSFTSENPLNPDGLGNSFTTPNITETTSFFVEATANGCPSQRQEVIATVNFEPSPGVPEDTFACSEVGPQGTTILDLDTTLTGADQGEWSLVTDPSNGGITINTDNSVDFAGLPLGDYLFRYTTIGAQSPCTNQSVEVTISVIDCLLDADFDGLNDDIEEEIGTDPNNPDTDGDGIEDGQEVNIDGTDPLDDCDSVGGMPLADGDCDNDGLTNGEEVDLGTDPFDEDTDNDGLTDGEEVLVEDDPATDAVPEGPSDPLDDCDPFLTEDCNAEPIDILVEKFADITSPLLGDTINFTITVTNLSMDRGIDIVVTDLIDTDSGFQLLSSNVDSGIYDSATGLWTIPELLGEASTSLLISVRVIELGRLQNTSSLVSSFPIDGETSNNSATVEILVVQSQCVDSGTLCNLFSPNGDGVNDTLVLVNHQIFPNNTLQIFDRFGNLVYEVEGYDSTWDGTGENGNLPRGTYYYILNLGDGSDITKGWIQIIR